jgi:hypothetical protein
MLVSIGLDVKNGDFGQNRQNMSTSNACRIAGTHNAFRFFSFKTYIYSAGTQSSNLVILRKFT